MCVFVCSHFAVCLHYIQFPFFLMVSATTEIYTLSLHDALPISKSIVSTLFPCSICWAGKQQFPCCRSSTLERADRKSTRLNSSHVSISYAVFCLKKKILQQHAKGVTPFSNHGQGSLGGVCHSAG